MDRQIENVEVSVGQKPIAKTVAKSSYSSGHLMCRTPLWGIAGFLGCVYFAWVSFSHPADWSTPPKFPWTETPPLGVKLPSRAV